VSRCVGVRPSLCVCLSVSPIGALNVTHHGAARNADSAHFCPSITRTDILVVADSIAIRSLFFSDVNVESQSFQSVDDMILFTAVTKVGS